MTEYKKILCDYCEIDISSAESMPGNRLRLRCESLPHTSSVIYDVYMVPDIECDKHFCGLMCLKKWLHRKLND